MRQLPSKYAWMDLEPGPKIWLEARKHYGVLEIPGKDSNPNILKWACEVGVNGWYDNDDIPWCALFVGMVLKRCDYPVPAAGYILKARSYMEWGTPVSISDISWMDVLVFTRPGGNHVGFNCGYNPVTKQHLVYGGNQRNSVSFAWIDAENRLIAARRCPWKIAQPVNIRPILLTETGEVSTNEI